MSKTSTIRKEIDSDLITYDPVLTNEEIADLFNAKTRTGKHHSLTSGDLYDAFNKGEFESLSPSQVAIVDRILTLDDPVLEKNNSLAFVQLEEVFGNTSLTVGNIKTARKIFTTRAAELGITKVNDGDVKHARAL